MACPRGGSRRANHRFGGSFPPQAEPPGHDLLGQEYETLQCHFQEPSVLAHGKALQVLQPKAWMDLPRRKLGQGSHCCEVSHQWKWPAQKRTRLGCEVEAAPVVSTPPAARGGVHRSGSALKKKKAACVRCCVASPKPCLAQALPGNGKAGTLQVHRGRAFERLCQKWRLP